MINSDLPQKLINNYDIIKQISDSGYFIISQATNKNTKKLHEIRSLNQSSSFYKKNRDVAVTLFI